MKKASDILEMKRNRPVTMVTCYDYPTARALKKTDLDLILVGDSLAEVVYGYENTTFITIDIMLRHTEAVSRAETNKHIVGDMPAGTYDTPELAVSNARKFIEAGAHSVKCENPQTNVLKALKENHIQVMGHIGLTPQTIHDYKKQGKTRESAQKIIEDAKRLTDNGCYALVVEAVPADLGREITRIVSIPTIGIASGNATDGQVIVLNDLLGTAEEERSYVKKIFHFHDDITAACETFITQTRLAYKNWK